MFTASSRSVGPLPAGQPSSAYKISAEGERTIWILYSQSLRISRKTDGVQVNIVVVPFDRQNLLNMTRLKQWIRVIV